MSEIFILRSHERGYIKLPSEILPSGSDHFPVPSTYVAGHPDTYITRYCSFNFHEYQRGIPGFGKIRAFVDEVFTPNGCGYNMHPHHNFIIMAIILKGALTHVNTAGQYDHLKPGDYYVFSTGSGGKHSELNVDAEDLHVIYIWIIPAKLYAPPSYTRAHIDINAENNHNKIIPLIGNDIEGALPLLQDFKISRLIGTTNNTEYTYKTMSEFHGVYLFVIEGSVEIEDTRLEKRDSIALCNMYEIAFKLKSEKADVLIVETTM